MDPYDISEADYIEFDFYSDVDTTFQISVGSCSTTRNPLYNNFFEFYDIRSNRKSVTVKAGWNHMVIETGNEFLVQDPTTTYPGTYNYHAVDGIVLHGPESNYIRLTNIALTSVDEVVSEKDDTSTEIIEDSDLENFDEDLNKLKEFFVLLIRVIFKSENNNLETGDINSDNSVDMIDIIIIKNKILEIIVIDY